MTNQDIETFAAELLKALADERGSPAINFTTASHAVIKTVEVEAAKVAFQAGYDEGYENAFPASYDAGYSDGLAKIRGGSH